MNTSEDIFTIIYLNEDKEEEKWSFSYMYYSFIFLENENIVNVFNNFGKKIKSFKNVLILS